MAFGQKTGSLKNLKKSLAKGGGKGFIKYIPKNGSMNVRYIEEPENWVNYVEHYDQTIRKSYPCSGEASCPGCASGERKSSRYLANVVDLDDQNKRVVPLQMPKDLANRLVVKYEKWGSITDRDIELSRSGEGLDTVYDLDASVPDRKSIAKYQPIDLLKTLEDAYNAVFGDDEDDDEEETVKPAVRGRGRSAAAKKATAPKGTTLDEDDEDEEEEPAPKPARKRAAKKAAAPEPDEDEEEDEEPAPKRGRKKAPEPEFVPDEDDDEPEEDDEDEGDDEGFTEDDLRAMSFGVLRATARSFGVSTKGKSADEIIEEIMEEGEAEDDD